MLKLRSNRCKSTTDILNEAVDEKENLWPTDSRANKSRSTEELNSCGDNKSKSHGFVRKLIASLEKRNDLCKANDEFWSVYRRTSDSCPVIQNEFIGAKTNDQTGKIRGNDQSGFWQSVKRTESGANQARQSLRGNERTVDFLKKLSNPGPNRGRNRVRLLQDEIEKFCPDWQGASQFENIPMIELRSESVRRLSCLEIGSKLIEETNELHCRNDHREYFDKNDFEPRGRSLNRSLSDKGDFGRVTSDDVQVVKGVEMIGSMTLDRTPNKKVSRRKSFRKFLGSMMKWGKSLSKEEPRRFLSCDDLIGDRTGSKVTSFEELSKTLSLEANLDSEKKRREEFGRTVRNVPEEPRTRNVSRSFRGDRARREAAIYNNFTDPVDQKHVACLVKPTTVKDNAKRPSQRNARALKH